MVGRAPDQVTDLLDTNPSYVFFKLGKPGTSGSKGSMGRRITPWVSVATDQSVLPNGLLTLMNVTLPDEGGEHSVPFNALTLPQDTAGRSSATAWICSAATAKRRRTRPVIWTTGERCFCCFLDRILKTPAFLAG